MEPVAVALAPTVALAESHSLDQPPANRADKFQSVVAQLCRAMVDNESSHQDQAPLLHL